MTEHHKINILDPLLSSASGHGFSFIAALVSAAKKSQCDMALWVSRKFVDNQNIFDDGVVVRQYFKCSTRRIQEFFLVRRLLKSDDRLFWVTASKTELIILLLAASKRIVPKKSYLYFHWLRLHPVKKFIIKIVSKVQPNIEVFGPTQGVVNALKESGFLNARLVPYPITRCPTIGKLNSKGFSHLIFAGTVRIDKGFRYVIDVIEFIKNKNMNIKISMPFDDRAIELSSEEIKNEYSRLDKIGYMYINKLGSVQDTINYFEQFSDGICLQLYDSSAFEDRISGVTLDALSMGCPVISSSGTWTSRIVEKYNAGIVLPEVTAELIINSAKIIINNYDQYRVNALKAGEYLQCEGDAIHLLNELLA